MIINQKFRDAKKINIELPDLNVIVIFRDFIDLKLKDYIEMMNNDIDDDIAESITEKLIDLAVLDGEKVDPKLLDRKVKLLILKNYIELKKSERVETQEERLGIKPKKVTIDFRFMVGKFMRFYNYRLNEVYELTKREFDNMYEVIEVVREDELDQLSNVLDASVLLNTPGGVDMRRNIIDVRKKTKREFIKVESDDYIEGFENIFNRLGSDF